MKDDRADADARARLEAEFAGVPLQGLVTKMAEVQREIEALDESKKSMSARLDFLRYELIPRTCEETGIETLRVVGVGRLGLTGDMHVSVRAGMSRAAQEWLADNGLGDLVKPAVAPSTLKAAIRDRVKSGEPVPEKIFNVSPFTRASITKS